MDGKFDVLMRQLPGWFKPVLEYIAIMQSYGWALGDTEEIVQRLHDNDFIQTADSENSSWVPPLQARRLLRHLKRSTIKRLRL